MGLSSTEATAYASRVLAPGERVESVVVVPTDGLAEDLTGVVTRTGEGSRAFYVRPDGSVLPSHWLPRLEGEALHARYGNLAPALFDQQVVLADQDTVDVAIFVDGDYLEPELPFDGTDLPVDVAAFEAWVASQRALQAVRLREAKQTLTDELEASGAVLDTELRQLPIIDARVPVALLRSTWLNTDPRVNAIFGAAEQPARLLGYAAHGSMNAEQFIGGACGPSSPCPGAGLTVGIWEHDDFHPTGVDRSGIATDNGRIAHEAWYYVDPTFCVSDAGCPDTLVPANPNLIQNKRKCQNLRCVEEHVSYTAASMGMLGSWNYGWQSPNDENPNAETSHTFASIGLYDVRYLVGNDNYVAGLDYLLNPSIDPGAPPAVYVNRSVDGLDNGSPVLYAAEWAARQSGVFITAAGGNYGAGSQSVCAYFRNGLCVGGYKYVNWNLLGQHQWWTGSNDGNAPGYPERPHLLGPAIHNTQVNSGFNMPDITSVSSMMRFGDFNVASPEHPLNPPQGIAIQGTSLAAPSVMAVALQAHQYEGFFSYLAYPPVNKAVLLAGTVDANVDGAIGTSTTWSSTPDAKDGAGQIDLTRVKQILDGNTYVMKQLLDSDLVSCGAGCREWVAGSVTIPLGGGLRTALAWQACTTGATIQQATAPVLNNDLDLAVRAQCGKNLFTTTYSNTITSEVEMVQITSSACSPCASCTATIRVRIKNGATLQPCGTIQSERLGVAWSQP